MSHHGPYIPTNQAAKRLGVDETTLRRWFDQGHIKGHQLPSGHRRIPLSEIERLETQIYKESE